MSVSLQYLVSSTLLIAMSMATVMASSGEELYRIKSACCHHNENIVHIDQSKIKKALTEKNFQADYFKLSASDTTILIDYISQVKAQ